MLQAITWDDAARIMTTDTRYTQQRNPRFRETVLEYLLATLVLKNTLGEDWWQAGENEVATMMAGGKRGSTLDHPLTPFLAALRGKYYEPKLAGQVINLAIDFLTLIDLPEANESLEQKVPELKLKRGQSFHDAWFEVRMAATFIKKGMSAKLLQPSPKEKRPDIEVEGPDGRVFVECKTRTKLSPEERSSPMAYRRKMDIRLSGVTELIRKASAQLINFGSPALITVNVDILDNVVGTLELKQLRSMMESTEIRNPHLNGIMLVVEKVSMNPATEIVEWGQELKLQRNMVNPTYPNPTKFFDILQDPSITTRPPTLMLTEYAKTH
jgi:hypothetical protein